METMIIDDQGGGRIAMMKDDVAPTLRAETRHHEPLVADVYHASTASYFLDWRRGGAVDTLIASDRKDPPRIMQMTETYENHPNDSRVKECEAPNLCARAGTGGNNVPLVMERTCTFSSNGYGDLKESAYAETLTTDHAARIGNDNAALVKETVRCIDMGGGKSSVGIGEKCAPTLCTTHGGEPAVAIESDAAYSIAENTIGRKPRNGGSGKGFHKEVAYTAEAMAPQAVATRSAVRRFTPVEAERLMGFPDNHTRIPYRGKPAEECPDGPRYKACGNSMAVNVMEWIGLRIQMVEDRIAAQGGTE